MFLFCPPRDPTLFSAKVGVYYYLIDSARLEANLGLNVDLYSLETGSVLEIPWHLNVVRC